VELLFEGSPVDLQYTDHDGRFAFVNVMPRRYKVSAMYSGYDAAVIDIDLLGSTWVLIEMNRAIKPASNDGPAVMSRRDYVVPERARQEFDRGQKEIRRQDCAKAIEHFENGLRLFGGSATVLNDLGNCYRKVGDLEKAEESFKRAMTFSDNGHIALNLAEVFTAEKRFADAEQVLLDAIRKAPQNGDIYFGLAAAYFTEGRLPDAEAAALQADARPHGIADLHLLMAKINLRKSPEEVLNQLELYLKEAPNGPESKRIRQLLKSMKAGR
jgi:tetratricopeptide (TPR) repeat protein